MASRPTYGTTVAGRPRPSSRRMSDDPIVDMYLQQAASFQEQVRTKQLARDLVQQGFDPEELKRYYRQTGSLDGLIQKPKPRGAQDDQVLQVMKKRAQMAHAQNALNPSKRITDDATGQLFQEQQTADNPNGVSVSRRPVLEAGTDIPLYDAKPGAFKGQLPTGEKWQMDRSQYGGAQNYSETSPKPPRIRRETDSQGRVIEYHQEPDPEGGFLLRPIIGKNPDGSVMYDIKQKMKWQSPDGLVQGEAHPNEMGNWNEETAKYDLTDTAKNYAREFASRTSQLKNAINGLNALKTSLMPNMKDPGVRKQLFQANAELVGAQQSLTNVENRRKTFEGALDRNGMLDKMPRPQVDFAPDFAPAIPSGAGPAPSVASPSAGGAPVFHRVKSPTGSIKMIPADSLDDALGAGGQLIDE